MSKEFEFFLKANLKKYKGKYIAIVDDKAVWEKARKKYPNKILTIAKLPKEKTLILI
jgi:hypothetical protein